MAQYIKVGGAWKTVSIDADSVQNAFVKVGGTWKGVTAAYVKVAGTWKQYFTYSAYVVPNVVGQVWATGKTNITNSGNIVGTSTTVNNAGGATPTNDGKIATQSVTAGVYLTPQTVNLTYYVFTYINVPSVVGQTVSNAQTLVQNSGNTWGTGSYYTNAQGATAGNNNTVLSQSPAAGQYVTAQTVNYGYYLYTVPTPSQPSVSLVSKGTISFTFSVSFSSNTTSALMYWGPNGSPASTLLGTATYSGQQFTVSSLSPSTTYQFTAYPVNTQNVNTIGNQSVTGSPASAGSVTTDAQPVPAGGSVSLSGTGQAGTTVSASASGFTNSPTSYDVFITTTTSGTPTASDTRVASSGGGFTASFTVTSGQAAAPANIFKAFATATNNGGTSSPPVASSNTITAYSVTPPSGGSVTLNWLSGSGAAGSQMFTSASGWTGTTPLSYYTIITTTTSGGTPGPNDTIVASGASNFVTYTVSASDAVSPVNRFAAYNTATNSGGSLQVGPSNVLSAVSAPPPPSNPNISVSNAYSSPGGTSTWTLTISNSGGAASSYSWGIQFSNASGGTVLASATGSGGTIPAGGTVTVVRNSSTYSWARWVSIVTNPASDSGTQSTGWA
jgi:hypothetical protein